MFCNIALFSQNLINSSESQPKSAINQLARRNSITGTTFFMPFH